MKTYFIRHTWKLNIDAATRARLIEEGRIAIHYPDSPTGLGVHDVNSLDPDDHDRKGANILRRFKQLAEEGGFVCAEYFGTNGVTLGTVSPGSLVELVYGHWHQPPERVAILKTIRLDNIRKVSEGDAAPILVARPRQGTFMCWPRAGRSIERLLRGGGVPLEFDSLSPDQQELLCAEFLRTELAEQLGLPRLAHLVVPVGRTMRDIDIIGISDKGHQIIAQVTFLSAEHASHKVKALSAFADSSQCLLFCDCSAVETNDSVTLVPIRKVYDLFLSRPLGKKWLDRALGL